MSNPVPRQYNIHEAKTQFSKLVEAVERGEEVIIARDGRPVAKLTAMKASRPKYRFGVMQGEFEIPADFDAPLPEWLMKEFYDSPIFPPATSRTRKARRR